MLHSKYAVFGHLDASNAFIPQTVWTGSFNFTENSVWQCIENVVVIRDPDLAMRFYLDFQRIHDFASGKNWQIRNPEAAGLAQKGPNLLPPFTPIAERISPSCIGTCTPCCIECEWNDMGKRMTELIFSKVKRNSEWTNMSAITSSWDNKKRGFKRSPLEQDKEFHKNNAITWKTFLMSFDVAEWDNRATLSFRSNSSVECKRNNCSSDSSVD
jgi:phosphatidylserine/phosphatidylglycerophosphate/cardiolipin synthase-like enzyme